MICGTIAGPINGTLYGTLNSNSSTGTTLSSEFWYWQDDTSHIWQDDSQACFNGVHGGGGGVADSVLWEDGQAVLLEDGEELQWEL